MVKHDESYLGNYRKQVAQIKREVESANFLGKTNLTKLSNVYVKYIQRLLERNGGKDYIKEVTSEYIVYGVGQYITYDSIYVKRVVDRVEDKLLHSMKLGNSKLPSATSGKAMTTDYYLTPEHIGIVEQVIRYISTEYKSLHDNSTNYLLRKKRVDRVMSTMNFRDSSRYDEGNYVIHCSNQQVYLLGVEGLLVIGVGNSTQLYPVTYLSGDYMLYYKELVVQNSVLVQIMNRYNMARDLRYNVV